MKIIIISLLAAAFAAPLTADIQSEDLATPVSTYQVCSSNSAIFNLTLGSFSPNPIKKGQELNLHIIGQLSEDITKGSKVQVSIKYGFVTLIDSSYDLCDLVGKYGTVCPVPGGAFNVEKSVEIPGIAPGGKYSVGFQLKNGNGKEIGCTKGTFYL